MCSFFRSLSLFLVLTSLSYGAQSYPDRFVWVFGWGLGKDSDVSEIGNLIGTASKHHINGAVVSFGLDSLCKQTPEYFARLEQIRNIAAQKQVELIPAVFSVGYGGGFLAHDPNLAEGVPVLDAPFLVENGQAFLANPKRVQLLNGGFEDHEGDKAHAFKLQDQPGEVSFVDTRIKHGGAASLRMDLLKAKPYEHARVMQEVRLQPHRCYRLSLWVKTSAVDRPNTFYLKALANGHDLAPREFHLRANADWSRVSMFFNSLDEQNVLVYAGFWGAGSGTAWFDDFVLEEIGPVNVLRRPGTPVTVKNEDGSVTHVEGQDYAPLKEQHLHLWREDPEVIPLKILPNGRIHEGDKLQVSWFHSMLIGDSQVSVCMAEPELYAVMDEEARLLAERLHPRRVLLGVDEVRMGGTCNACRGRDMAQLLGECTSQAAAAIRKYNPGAQLYVWSDMFDPNHNAHGNYYLVKGDFTGSWKHIHKDLVMAVWGGEPRPKSLSFFASQGFSSLIACYYDANNLNDVKGWLTAAGEVSGVRGLMYTPWEKKYSLLPQFGDLLAAP